MHWLRHSSERLLVFPSEFILFQALVWSLPHPIQEEEMVSTSRAPPQSYWKLFEGNQGPLVIRKQGVCIRMEAFVYIHSRARDSKLLSYGFSSLGGERTSLASLFQASSTGHASGSGNQNLSAFPSCTQNFRSHQVAEFPWYQKKVHYGWMQGTDLIHNQWFLPASDKACFLQLIMNPGNTPDVCFQKQILHSKPTCPHLPPSKGKNQVVQFFN